MDDCRVCLPGEGVMDMTYRRLPLFPPGCGCDSQLNVPLFENRDCCRPGAECQRVHIRNPACPGEWADVELCVDEWGNLSVCVKRPPRPCAPNRCRPRHGCR